MLYAATGAGRVLAIAAGGEPRELFRVPAVEVEKTLLITRPGTADLLRVTGGYRVNPFRVWDGALGRLVYPRARTINPAASFSIGEYETHATNMVRGVVFHGPDSLAVHELDTIRTVGFEGADPPRNRDFAQHTRNTADLAGSTDGSRLAVATTRGIVVIWDALQSRQLSQIKLAGRAVPQTLAVSQTGVVALALADELRFYDADTGTLTASSLTGKSITLLALSPADETCLSSDGGPGVTIWRGGKPAGRYDFGVGKVRAMAIAPDGLTAAIGGTARQVAVVDLEA